MFDPGTRRNVGIVRLCKPCVNFTLIRQIRRREPGADPDLLEEFASDSGLLTGGELRVHFLTFGIKKCTDCSRDCRVFLFCTVDG